MKTMTMAIGQGVLLASVALGSTPAGAETQNRVFGTNPAGICQGALPAFETAIRKRPLAIQNEGSTTAFITCSFTSQGEWGGSARNPTRVSVFVNNASGAAVPLSCTGVTGYATQSSSHYVVKQVNLTAGTGQHVMNWVPADFQEGATLFPSGLFSISCGLPPGVAINDSYVHFSEEVGAL